MMNPMKMIRVEMYFPKKRSVVRAKVGLFPSRSVTMRFMSTLPGVAWLREDSKPA